MTKHLEEGLYFGLDDDVYHSLPYLSASGIKKILISPMDFWATSWMNPLKKEQTEDSDAKIIGKAYHKRILEGRDAFYDYYTPEFDTAAHIHLPKTNDDLKEILRQRGLSVSGNKPDLMARLKASDPTIEFYDEVYASWRETEAFGKIPLNHDLIARIEVSAAMIENHPELRKFFNGGYPEVSVIWQDQGIFFKSRFDYLKPRAISDLKTFENMMGKPVDKAIYYAMASQKYHIQSSFYMEHAARKAVEFAQKGRVFGFATKGFLTLLSQAEQHDFYFLFQQKGIAPVARGFKFPRDMMFGCGMQAIEDAIKKYKDCLSVYGESPWVDPEPIQNFEDSQFPVFATEL